MPSHALSCHLRAHSSLFIHIHQFQNVVVDNFVILQQASFTIPVKVFTTSPNNCHEGFFSKSRVFALYKEEGRDLILPISVRLHYFPLLNILQTTRDNQFTTVTCSDLISSTGQIPCIVTSCNQ